jgi:peptidylprolyl isomerase
MRQDHRGLRSRWGAAVALVAVLALVVTACTGEEAPEGGEDAAGEAVAPPDLASKPDLVTVLPDDRGDPPDTLQVEDLVVGEGQVAEEGARLTVEFVGASWSSGQQFDATWDRGQPYSFTLGAGEVIRAWDEGLSGMRVGGRRALVVPPDLAYGDRGSAAGIGPGETIVFIVDLLEVDAG